MDLCPMLLVSALAVTGAWAAPLTLIDTDFGEADHDAAEPGNERVTGQLPARIPPARDVALAAHPISTRLASTDTANTVTSGLERPFTADLLSRRGMQKPS